MRVPSTQLAIALALAAIAPGFPVAALFDPSPTADLPSAISVRAPAMVAAVFGAPDTTPDHTCTASVVSSSTRDLLITAAHCVSGDGTDIKIAPGYNAGRTPYGVWSVTAAFVDSAWQSDQSESDDVAFLRVAPQSINGVRRELQDVTGADTLGTTPDASSVVTASSFNAGSGDHAVSCTTGLGFVGSNPTFRCDGFSNGSSGSPWLVTGTDGITRVTGVIGGLHEGGCRDSTSYSPVFGAPVSALLARAEQAGDDGDDVRAAGPALACSSSTASPGE